MVMVQGCLRYHFLSMESAIPFQVNSWKSVTNETVEKKDDIYVTVCVFEVFVRRGRDDMQTRASKQTDPPPCSKSLRYAVNEPPLYRNSFLIILGFNIFFNIVAQEFYLRLCCLLIIMICILYWLIKWLIRFMIYNKTFLTQ